MIEKDSNEPASLLSINAFQEPRPRFHRDFTTSGQSTVIASDAVTKKRFKMSHEVFVDSVASSIGIGDAKDRILGFLQEVRSNAEGLPEEPVSHWIKREWLPSLEYYLWSRAVEYTDRRPEERFVDDSGEPDRIGLRRATDARRAEVVRAFVADEGMPREAKLPKSPWKILGSPVIPRERSLGDVLMSRRTRRVFITDPVQEAAFTGVMHCGLSTVRDAQLQQSRATDGGDLLGLLHTFGVAFDFYVVLYAVQGFEPGIYRYDVVKHQLALLQSGNFRELMRTVLAGQAASRTAGFTILIVADYARYRWRYRHERALRNLYIEVGRVAQRLIVAGGLYGLSSFPTPAIADQVISKLLELESFDIAPLYTITMGVPLERSRPSNAEV